MNSDTDEDIFDTDDFHLEQGLRNLYHRPGSGYRSIETLYRRAKEKGFDVSRKQVRNFLRTQDTYTKTKPLGGPGLGKKKYRKTIVGKLGEQLQMDLVIMSKKEMPQENDGYENILTSIEVLSRFAFTEPVKKKTGEETARAMDLILVKFK